MRIAVKGSLMFRQLLGEPRPLYLDMEGGTLEDLLERLCRRFGDPLEKMVFESARQGLRPSILVLLNGVTHWNLKQGLATELKNGDEVELRPMAAGG